MLILAKRLGDLSFAGLMAVYPESNGKKGRENWPEEPEMRQIALAEADCYDYLSQVFFRVPGAVYAVWESGGQYCCALRLEPFRDGWLLSGLETRPDCRHQGWGEMLLRAVLEQVEGKVYSHVARDNGPSLGLHEKCGFRKISERSVYADGSVDSRCATYLYEKEQSS